MKHELPQFVPIESTGALAGGLLYRWQCARDLTCYIYLQISAKDNEDSFVVELSCSRGDFPANLVAFGPNEVKGGSVRFRLPELYRQEWGHNSRRIPWWWIGPPPIPDEITSRAVARAVTRKRPLTDEAIPIEKALRLVEPQVRDAIDRIKRFGIPFFEQFAQRRSG